LIAVANLLCQKRQDLIAQPEMQVTPEEIKKLDAYFKSLFSGEFSVRARPKKTDSCEVYKGDEFIGVLYLDEDEGERSYNFSMAILDIDIADM
jgi:hypothetical protein